MRIPDKQSPVASRGGSLPRSTSDAQERLLLAAGEVAAHRGYATLTVQKVLDAADVSRATFYQYFANIDDCFWSAFRRRADQLIRDVALAVRQSDEPEIATVEALAAAACREPELTRLLMCEGLAAGPRGLSERDALISRIEAEIIGAAERRPTIDLPLTALIGGAFRFVAIRLSGGGRLESAGAELREWAGTFRAGSSGARWSVRLSPTLPRAGGEPASCFGARLAGTPRERILQATALTAREVGYPASTVTDIVAVASVSRRTFYNEFSGKSDAFVGAYELAFQRVLAACTPAFFTARTWRERVWNGALAFTGYLAREPLFAHLGFVECYAIGPGFTTRLHDTQLAFTLFLEEGYREGPQAEALSRSCSELTAAAIFELAFQGTRLGPGFSIRRLQPLAVYTALAPFIGTEQAGRFIEDKLTNTLVSSPAAA
jgi:AcrR family transcriptional regulator